MVIRSFLAVGPIYSQCLRSPNSGDIFSISHYTIIRGDCKTKKSGLKTGYFRKFPFFLISAPFSGEKCNFRAGKLRNYEYKTSCRFFWVKFIFLVYYFISARFSNESQEPGRKNVGSYEKIYRFSKYKKDKNKKNLPFFLSKTRNKKNLPLFLSKITIFRVNLQYVVHI